MKAIKALLALAIAASIALLLPFAEARAVFVFIGGTIGITLISVAIVWLVWGRLPWNTMYKNNS